MPSATGPLLIDGDRPGRLGMLAGRLLGLAYRLTGHDRYDAYRHERVCDLHLLVIPTVANPRSLRTGAFFAAELEASQIARHADVLDLGTGSGICALVAARNATRVVATDLSSAATRCARANASINDLEDKIDIRQGDLFAPVAGEKFDLIMFNPPFLNGEPINARDAAWRANGLADRFAEGLAEHLQPKGSALILLSSFGDACPAFEAALRNREFELSVFARRRLINETLTLLRATPPRDSEEGS